MAGWGSPWDSRARTPPGETMRREFPVGPHDDWCIVSTIVVTHRPGVFPLGLSPGFRGNPHGSPVGDSSVKDCYAGSSWSGYD